MAYPAVIEVWERILGVQTYLYERASVVLPYTDIHPRTVMIQCRNAETTQSTVLHTWSLYDFTYAAYFHFASDEGNLRPRSLVPQYREAQYHSRNGCKLVQKLTVGSRQRCWEYRSRTSLNRYSAYKPHTQKRWAFFWDAKHLREPTRESNKRLIDPGHGTFWQRSGASFW